MMKMFLEKSILWLFLLFVGSNGKHSLTNLDLCVDTWSFVDLVIEKDGVSGEVGVGVKVCLGPLVQVRGDYSVGAEGARVNVDASIHAGVVDASARVNADSKGHVIGEVGGNVNVGHVDVGGNVGVNEKRQAFGGASVGLAVGPLGGIDVHANAGPDGFKIGVGARMDVGPFHGSASVDVDQNGNFEAKAGAKVLGLARKWSFT